MVFGSKGTGALGDAEGGFSAVSTDFGFLSP
jgi:hypothetical protein